MSFLTGGGGVPELLPFLERLAVSAPWTGAGGERPLRLAFQALVKTWEPASGVLPPDDNSRRGWSSSFRSETSRETKRPTGWLLQVGDSTTSLSSGIVPREPGRSVYPEGGDPLPQPGHQGCLARRPGYKDSSRPKFFFFFCLRSVTAAFHACVRGPRGRVRGRKQNGSN